MPTTHNYMVQIDHTRANADSMTVPAVLSTEYPAQRKGFIEVLSHKPGAVDTSRFPLPVIESHDGSKVNIGIVEHPQLVEGKLRGLVRFGNSARAKELFSDIQAGIVKNLSIGYEWLEYQEQGDTFLSNPLAAL